MSEVQVRWQKVIDRASLIVKFINLGNGTQFKLISFLHGNKLFVALERIGAFFFDTSRSKSAEYVSEKLNIPFADAAIMADWINAQCETAPVCLGLYNSDYIPQHKNEDDFYDYYDHTIHPIIIG